MRIHVEITVEPPRLRQPRRPRTLVVLAAVAVALLLPAAALASHMFSDVPTSHTFHTNISNLANAGVTAGCGGGKYCPEDPVTRGQMAGFLNRGLGRIAENAFGGSKSGVTDIQIGSATITPGTSSGAVAGAKQFLDAEFHGWLNFSDITSCPCEMKIYLARGTEHLQANDVRITVRTAGDYFPISAGGAIAVTGSDPVTIALHAVIQSGGSPATAYGIAGDLTVETIPFGSTGTSAP